MAARITRRGLFKASGFTAAAAVVAGLVGTTTTAFVAPKTAKAFGWTDDQEPNEDYIEAGRDLSKRILDEGAVLMKNDGVLPLASGAKVTILGSMSYNYVEGGTGSAGGKDDEYTIMMNDAFNDAGLDVNPGAWDALATACGGERAVSENDPAYDPNTADQGGPMGPTASWTSYQNIHEFPISTYEEYKDDFTAAGYTDTAIVTFSRSGAEGASPSMDYDGDGSTLTGTTYLELDDDEKDLLAFCAENYKQTIVIVNSAVPMEMGFIDDDSYNVKGCVWIGHPGEAGLLGLADVLTGAVNPSGHTVDTWAYDMITNPTYYNTDNNKYTNVGYKTGQFGMSFGEDLGATGEALPFYQYEEGIYVGYRFFETADAEGYFDGSYFTSIEWKNGKAKGYDQVVQFPFGFGLSYTTFSQKITGSDIPLKAHGTNSINVKVTNTGDVAGKTTVQVYMDAPFATDTDNFGIKGVGLQKSKVVLIAFAKTDELEPGASAEYALDFNTDDLASFDNFGQGCYVLENGTYKFNVQENAHMWGEEGSSNAPYASVSVDLAAPIIYDESGDVSGATYAGARASDKVVAKNSMDDVTAGDGNMLDGYLSRSDFDGGMKQIMTHTSDETPNEQVTDALKACIECAGTNSVDYQYETYKKGVKTTLSETIYARGSDMMPWAPTTPDGTDVADWSFPEWEQVYYVDEGATTGDIPVISKEQPSGANHKLGLSDMAKVPIDTDEGMAVWDALASMVTMDEAAEIQGNHGWKVPAIPSLGFEQISVNDGPGEARNGSRNGATWWPCAVTLCSTWNAELTYEYGQQYGLQAIDAQEQGAYAPAMNLHRSPFGGRNFEYWSEDGFISGKLAGPAAAGIQSKGVIIFPKHCALNDGDTNRGGNTTWANEQAIRELYMRPYEITIKDYGAKGIMGSLNRIGMTWFHYGMYVTMMRNEWGWHGTLITDGDGNDGDVYNNPQMMLCIEGDILNNGGSIFTEATTSVFGDATQYAYAQQMLHNITRNCLYQVAGGVKSVSVHANYAPGETQEDADDGETVTALGSQSGSSSSSNNTPLIVGGVVAAAAVAGAAYGISRKKKAAGETDETADGEDESTEDDEE